MPIFSNVQSVTARGTEAIGNFLVITSHKGVKKIFPRGVFSLFLKNLSAV